jgi:excisionase family DNA binding protein
MEGTHLNPMPIDSNVLTVKELSKLLRVHSTTIYKLIRQDKIPRFRVGNEWRFRTDVIMRWMAEKSMQARQVRKVIESGVNGETRHRRKAALRGPIR